MKFLIFFIFLLQSVYFNVASAAVINGDFENGFNEWTVTTGFCCGNSASINAFDITGEGSPTNTAVFQVGSTRESLYQSFSHSGGEFNFSADIASVSTSNNADGGQFEVFLNDSLISSYYFGHNSISTLYSSLEYLNDNLAAGLYDLRIDIFRDFGSSAGSTPRQYIDNINTASISAVPLPASMYLFLSALGVLSLIRKKG